MKERKIIKLPVQNGEIPQEEKVDEMPKECLVCGKNYFGQKCANCKTEYGPRSYLPGGYMGEKVEGNYEEFDKKIDGDDEK